jgi:cytoskeletal protein CcmA (bactofilin family)
MWKWTRKDENKSAPPIPSAVSPVRNIPSQESAQTVPRLQSVESFGPDVTHIGKSIVIKGNVSGGGNVYLDGELEGSVELLDGGLTGGPDGRIRANVQARSIVVQGRVDGNLYGLEHAELKKSATVVGDIYTSRIAIEDGAFLEGSVQVHKDTPFPQTKIGDAAATVKAQRLSERLEYLGNGIMPTDLSDRAGEASVCKTQYAVSNRLDDL